MATGNAILVLKLNERTGHWGLLNIVEIVGGAEGDAQSRAVKLMTGWMATYPGATMKTQKGFADTCKSVNNPHGFV